MSALEVAFGICLIVAVGALPPGIVRTVAYRSGEIDHTPTMRTAAVFAMALGLAGLLGVLVLGALLLA